MLKQVVRHFDRTHPSVCGKLRTIRVDLPTVYIQRLRSVRTTNLLQTDVRSRHAGMSKKYRAETPELGTLPSILRPTKHASPVVLAESIRFDQPHDMSKVVDRITRSTRSIIRLRDWATAKLLAISETPTRDSIAVRGAASNRFGVASLLAEIIRDTMDDSELETCRDVILEECRVRALPNSGKLTLIEAAELMGLNKSQVWRYVKQGRLQSERGPNRQLLLDRAEVLSFQPSPRGRPRKPR